MLTYNFDGSVKIVNLGDIHRGNKNCNTKLLKNNIDIIASTEGMYWVSTGDMLETATKNSKSSCYEAYSPEEELEFLAEELVPIRTKCLGFVASNHQDRVYKEVGLSLDKALAYRAKIPYLGISAVIKVTCARCSYFIHMHHGVGGGSSGNKVNRAIALASNWIGADIYLTGHTHSVSHVPDITTVIDRKRNRVVDLTTHHVCTGHYIIYEKSYAEKYGLKKKPMGSSVIILAAHGSGREAMKDVKVEFLG